MFNLSRINRFWRVPLGGNWPQNTRRPSPTEVEDSVSLRVLVLALVILGIVATDVAANETFSIYAVPLSVVGTVWSHYCRRLPNVAAKFCIAIGMLVALGVFFGQLVQQLNDTRLTLAGLLIQLQILHSFDTPRRKDLGYSIVIGLILLGVAATLSETMAFGLVVLLFLAIALPTLILDYRSRLGLKPDEKPVKTRSQNVTHLNFKSLIINFALITGLGLTVFALLPRFPGYQLRSFPVSSPIEVQGALTERSIINPGYVREGNGNNQGSGEDNGEAGELDDTYYYGFNSQMNQNLRGQMTPKVVMRVRSQAEGFWRVLAFDRYTGKGWEISQSDDVDTFRRPGWSYQIQLPLPLFSGKSQDVVQTYSIVSSLPNLIPAMAFPKEIYFPTPIVALDKENGLRSPVELSDGLTYTVISEVPHRNRSLLNQAGNKYPGTILRKYLQVPSEIADKVRKRTEEILADYNQQSISRSKESKTLDSAYEKALYLAQYLKQNYSFPDNPLNLPYLGEKDDLVETFLFKQKGGYPDHFSTVLTIMLRSIGIPARLVAGFAPGEFNPFTGMYVVRNTDAYAMTEVYFPKYGWFTFDPIPGHALFPPSVEDTETFSVLRQFWNWVAGWLPSPVTGFFNTIFAWIGGTISWFIGLFTQGLPGIITGLILSTTIAFFGWFVWVQWRKWLKYRWLQKLPPMENLYQQMLQWTAQKGFRKHPAQTPLEYAQVAYQHQPQPIAQVIDEICQAYVSWRYGGQNPNWQELRQKWQEVGRRQGAGGRR
ncbi:MAG TPA: DUF3488 and DUF4129 domain-containing transglutaminase family protein [Nostocaceae cyanobacterium]|nr:DUF3488 and DUF4129 domain-containing transglutaminase family protein [Nostocaceae cyanobacterium]